MARYTIVIIVFAFSHFVNGQECPLGNIDITDQAGLDQLMMDYPDCNIIRGNLNISGVSSLESLNSIDTILGNLKVFESVSLENLNGLSNIRHVKDFVQIFDNDNLQNIESLNAIHTTRGIFIERNKALKHIDGFDNITFLESLFVESNQNLESLQGFRNLLNFKLQPNNTNLIAGFLRIEIKDNPNLEHFAGFDNLQVINSLHITDCPKLIGLSFVSNPFIHFRLAINNVGIARLDNFSVNTEMDFIYLIEMDNLVDISGLSNVHRVTSSFILRSLPQLQNLVSLNNLTSVYYLDISSLDKIQSLAGLSKLRRIQRNIRIVNNPKLSSLNGLGQLDSIGGIPVANLSNLEIINNDELRTLEGLKSLKYLSSTMEISDNEKLIDISVLERVNYERFTSSSGATFSIIVRIEDNPKLSKCDYSFICNGFNQDFFNVNDNGPLCEHRDTILQQCNNLAKVQINYFIDENLNGIKDSSEVRYFDFSVNISPLNETYFITSAFSPPIFLNEGTYSFIPNIDQDKWNVTSSHLDISVLNGDEKRIEIGLERLFEDGDIDKQVFMNTRCHTDQYLFIQLKNHNTQIDKGIVWIKDLTGFYSEDFLISADTIFNERYGWLYNSFEPSELLTFKIPVSNPGPPEVEVGFIMNFEIEVVSEMNFSSNEILHFLSELRCSWDPNDKQVTPSRLNNEISKDDFLEYTIRFQNTGNDYAQHVTIIDTMTASLNLESIKILSTSHPEKLSTSFHNNVLKFDFPYIYLPDSISDNIGSQGFVKFGVYPNFETVENLDTIINFADIYFDSNPAIRTNSTLSIVSENLSTTNNEETLDELNIYPNPNNGIINFSDKTSGLLSLYSLNGQRLYYREISNESQVQVESELCGLYLLELVTKEDRLIKKITFIKNLN